jgi:Flp pilus assembly protein TadB
METVKSDINILSTSDKSQQTGLANNRSMALLSIFSLFAMAYVDYVTGYELVFSAAYLIPVSLCAWYFSRRAIWWMCIASGVAAFIVDALSGYAYSHFMIRYWNSLMCFAISLTTGLLLYRLRRTLEERKQMNEELQSALDELKRSTRKSGNCKMDYKLSVPGRNKSKWTING